MAITISLLNMKGGVGKTTLAVNLAWHFFAREHKNVLLVDLDPQFNATQYVMDYQVFDEHRTGKGTIADLLLQQPRMDLRKRKVTKSPGSVLHNVRTEGEIRFDLLPSELRLAWVVKNPAQMEYKLEKLLSALRSRYAYVFIDCAPTDSVLTTMALTASDFLLVPVRPDRFSILGFGNLVNTLQDFRENCNDPHSVQDLGVVFTQVTGDSRVEEECMQDIRGLATRQKSYVFKATLKHSNSFIRSVKEQTPIFYTWYARRASKDAASEIASEMSSRIKRLQATDK